MGAGNQVSEITDTLGWQLPLCQILFFPSCREEWTSIESHQGHSLPSMKRLMGRCTIYLFPGEGGPDRPHRAGLTPTSWVPLEVSATSLILNWWSLVSWMESAQASLENASAELLTCNLLASQNLHSQVMCLTRCPHLPEESPHMLKKTRSFQTWEQRHKV